MGCARRWLRAAERDCARFAHRRCAAHRALRRSPFCFPPNSPVLDSVLETRAHRFRELGYVLVYCEVANGWQRNEDAVVVLMMVTGAL